LLCQIQQEQVADVGPRTNLQSDGARNSLQEPQLWPLLDTVENLTDSWDSLTVALALVAASMDAEPAATPPASSIRREIRVEPRVWGFIMMSSLTTHDALTHGSC